MINKRTKNNKGYTLLFAVLVSSIVLSVGISILTISKKEFLLSSSARESISAFYAADSGLECALYHNDSADAFSSTTVGGISSAGQSRTFIMGDCMGTDGIEALARNVTDGGVGTYTFDFQVKMQNASSKACAIVTVTKDYYTDPEYGLLPNTTIISRGYNLGWNNGSCTESSPRRVERAIEYTF
jgi:hypothetical protein